MFLYTLTSEEVTTINALNYTRSNVLLIVCCHGEYTGVDPDALQAAEYADYLTALGSYDGSKVVEIEDTDPFGV
jgi:hypothetical protein